MSSILPPPLSPLTQSVHLSSLLFRGRGSHQPDLRVSSSITQHQQLHTACGRRVLTGCSSPLGIIHTLRNKWREEKGRKDLRPASRIV